MTDEPPSKIEGPKTLADSWQWALALSNGDALTHDALPEKGPAATSPEDRPVRIRITPGGIKLAFFHASRALPPFKLTIPHGQWAQMVQLIAETAPRVHGFEAYVGFTPESLALHQIDAVEVKPEGSQCSLRSAQ